MVGQKVKNIIIYHYSSQLANEVCEIIFIIDYSINLILITINQTVLNKK